VSREKVEKKASAIKYTRVLLRDFSGAKRKTPGRKDGISQGLRGEQENEHQSIEKLLYSKGKTRPNLKKALH